MMVSALTEAQAVDTGIMEAAVRQATEANEREPISMWLGGGLLEVAEDDYWLDMYPTQSI